MVITIVVNEIGCLNKCESMITMMAKRVPDVDAIIKAMAEKALQDGIITADERDLLVSIQYNAALLEVYIEDALEDGIINRTEAAKIKKLEENLINKAWKVAEADGEITDEEKELIEALIKLLKKKRKRINNN